MKSYPLKQIFALILLIFSIGLMVTSCNKKNIIPHNAVTKTGSDSTAAMDSLPSFYSPSGVAVDATGNIYVADYGNNLIRKITPAGIVSTLAGTGTQGSVNATGILASFSQPTGLTIDPSGSLYIADAGNNEIRLITQAGVVSTFAGSDSTGAVNGATSNALFFSPAGVTLDPSGNLYVADAGNNLIRKISGGVVSTFAGNGVDTLQVGLFDDPTGVATDATGNVYVANYLNSNILSINQSGTVNIFAGTGTNGATNGPGNAATFYFPNSVAVDASNNIYVSDEINNLIRKITPDGTVSTLAGSGVAGAADSTGTAASFNGPAGLAVDAAGNVYVADSNNNLIRKITPAGVVSTVAGSGLAGAKNGQAFARLNKKSIKTSGKKLRMFLRVRKRSY